MAPTAKPAKMTRQLFYAFGACACVALSAGCRRHSAAATPSGTPTPSIPAGAVALPIAAEAERARAEREHLESGLRAARARLTTAIHFSFDGYDLDAAARSILDQKLEILRINPGLRVRVTGHADNRGADEYNLVLGQRRAAAARRYLAQNGVDAASIETASLGEERPLCAAPGEDCWMTNRRAEFEVIGGSVTVLPPG